MDCTLRDLIIALVVILMVAGCDVETVTDPGTTTVADGTVVDTDALVSLGEKLYTDTDLSVPAGQSCASCHDLTTGFDDPDGTATSEGADAVSIGSRNAPTASYAAEIPTLTTVLRGPPGGPQTLVPLGGQFWDGRAATLEEQAKAPFLNPVEMANASKADVVNKVSLANYAADFTALFGADIFTDIEASYDYIADAIAAFERSEVFSPFTSKFDQVAAGTATFTAAEQRGQNIFNGKGDCDRCHETVTGVEVFSDFTYFNIGVPSNAQLLSDLGDPTFIDNGLGVVTGDAADNGKFRVQTLRNIADTAPYMHNGVFDTLEEVINFYNRRDIDGITPEVATNVDNVGNIGELGLTTQEISDLIAFLNTLSDQ